MAKLKVFAWSNGLKTYAVAATSRPKALQAWGIHQDLFADGTAHEVEDPGLIAATTAQPGVVVEQAISGGAAKAIAAVKPSSKPKGPTAAQKRVAELKAQLAALDDQHRVALDRIDAERRALDDRADALRREQQEMRAALAEKLRAAQARA
jgi:hypothetical protein